MSTSTFRCESCGAALTVTPAADFVSCRYCGSWWCLQSSVDLARPASPALSPAQEAALAALDREWDKEKEPYLILRRDGSRSAIKPAPILFGGGAYLLFIGCYDVGACVAALQQMAEVKDTAVVPWAPFLLLPLLGAIFTFIGVCLIPEDFKKALRYREACRRYRARRAAITLLPRRQVPGRCQARGKDWLGSESWYMADALEEARGNYRIRYQGWSDRYDKWVPRDQVRFPEDEE
jgi:hypothetical protein